MKLDTKHFFWYIHIKCLIYTTAAQYKSPIYIDSHDMAPTAWARNIPKMHNAPIFKHAFNDRCMFLCNCFYGESTCDPTLLSQAKACWCRKTLMTDFSHKSLFFVQTKVPTFSKIIHWVSNYFWHPLTICDDGVFIGQFIWLFSLHVSHRRNVRTYNREFGYKTEIVKI